MEIKSGNILKATEDYIVQQCCCIACKPHGLSAAIVAAFPHGNVYGERKPMKKGGNTAIEEDRAKPGTIQILGNGSDQRYIVCLFAQYAMGKPGTYDSFGVPDSAKDRAFYFAQSLEALAAAIPPDASLAFPYRIGCGLAGGNWKSYETMLHEWSRIHPALRVTLYELD